MTTTTTEEKRFRFEQLMLTHGRSTKRAPNDFSRYDDIIVRNMWFCYCEGFALGAKLVPEIVAERLAGK